MFYSIKVYIILELKRSV